MSHEGIRIISEQEAREQQRDARELPPAATEPLRVRVHKTEGTGMEIEWKDGHRSAWNFRWLRDACPCATCIEEREKEGRAAGQVQVSTLLPLYQDPPRPLTVTPTGRYAIAFAWNDGHTSGIYSWEYLRRHCVCSACQARNSGMETAEQERQRFSRDV